MGKDGYALRAELGKMTGRTSVPAIFVGGEFAGGCNDGGLGGIMSLDSQGKLQGMHCQLVHGASAGPSRGCARPGRRPCPRPRN